MVPNTNPGEASAQCEGKWRFDSRSLANQVAQRSARKHEDSRNVYRCPHCGSWHIGTRTKHVTPAQVKRMKKK